MRRGPSPQAPVRPQQHQKPKDRQGHALGAQPEDHHHGPGAQLPPGMIQGNRQREQDQEKTYPDRAWTAATAPRYLHMTSLPRNQDGGCAARVVQFWGMG